MTFHYLLFLDCFAVGTLCSFCILKLKISLAANTRKSFYPSRQRLERLRDTVRISKFQVSNTDDFPAANALEWRLVVTDPGRTHQIKLTKRLPWKDEQKPSINEEAWRVVVIGSRY